MKVIQVALRIVTGEDVHRIAVHHRRVSISRTRPFALNVKVVLPLTALDVEDEKVVPIHRTIVSPEAVQRAAPNHC